MYLCDMKNLIKEKLRENMSKNSLGILITRPNQELTIIRGIPGSGKSTKSKELVGEGRIHSTDDVIESLGDYRKFFEVMIESKNFSALHKAHSTNFKNAVKSMNDGVSPVIIDNTNIKANEPKNYVIEALKLGYDDANISIIDIGTGGSTAIELAERNKHGVPLDKIESMIKAYNSTGELTLKKILESKDMWKPTNKSKVLYSAVVLDKASIYKMLAGRWPINLPDGWIMGREKKYFCDHMTINLGELQDKKDLGKEVTLTATHIGLSDMAMALKVTGYVSKNETPHVTLAVNPDGGKPVMSNAITKWYPITQLTLTGVVTEVKTA